jgi:hypothetical protein
MLSALLLPLAATAAAAHIGPMDYKVVQATHTSTVAFADEHYHGRSTATWKLARPSRFRINWMAGGLFSGTGRLNVRGTYDLDATTDWPGRCAWSAPTGDAAHPLTAPAPFDLTVTPDARRPGMALVGFVAVQATLKNAYVGTECTPNADEPEGTAMQALDVRPSRLRLRTITLKFAGHQPAGAGQASYDWRTTIVLRRVERR